MRSDSDRNMSALLTRITRQVSRMFDLNILQTRIADRKKFFKRKELHMKVVMYGTKVCPDCVEAEEILKEKGIQYLYMEFSDNIGYLKRFLTLRDTNPIFDEVKENHWVGVPCFQFQDGSLSLDIDEVVKRAEEEV